MSVSSTNKKVVVVRFDREPLSGVASLPGLGEEGCVEILTSTGTLVKAPLDEVKAVCFAKDLPPPDAWRPNRYFAVRPKTNGLWLRFRFRDHDGLDGVVANNMLILEPLGFTIIPPDPSFLNQRIFVPRMALLEAQVMGVIGSPLRLKPVSRLKPKSPDQIEMFME